MNISKFRVDINEIIKQLQAFEYEAVSIAQGEDRIGRFELNLNEREKSINAKADQLKDRSKQLDQQEAYLKKAQAELDSKQRHITTIQQDQLDRIKLAEAKLEQNKKEQINELHQLEVKREEVTLLVAKAKEIADKEEMITKEIAMDRERKQLLDARENKIHATEERLQRIADV